MWDVSVLRVAASANTGPPLTTSMLNRANSRASGRLWCSFFRGAAEHEVQDIQQAGRTAKNAHHAQKAGCVYCILSKLAGPLI